MSRLLFVSFFTSAFFLLRKLFNFKIPSFGTGSFSRYEKFFVRAITAFAVLNAIMLTSPETAINMLKFILIGV